MLPFLGVMEVLSELGLSKREIKAYLSLLELGETRVTPLVKASGIPNSKIYETLDKLIKKGLVSYYVKENNKFYVAASPKTLFEIVDEKREKLNNILPMLMLKQRSKSKPANVEMYEGEKAIFRMLANIIEDAKPKEEYISFSLGEEHLRPGIETFYKKFIRLRKEKKLRIKALVNTKVRRILEKAYTKEELKTVNIRYTDFNFPQGIAVFRDKVTLMNWVGDATTILITSKNIASQFKKFFFELYDKAYD